MKAAVARNAAKKMACHPTSSVLSVQGRENGMMIFNKSKQQP
jgi:hypothetical protein